MNIHSNNRKQTGSTLIEVLIALLVFTIGLQGVASMQYQSIKDNFDSTQRSHGVWSGQELINRIRANPDGRAAGNYTTLAGNPCGGGIPEPFCADRDGDAADVCDAAQMAVFDIWESICPTPNQAHVGNLNNSQLLNPNLTIACADSVAGDPFNCSEGSDFTLTLQWQSKSVSDDDVTNDLLINEQFIQVFRP